MVHETEGKQGYGSIKFEAFDCMATTVPLNWGRIVLSGVLAGLAGGVCIDLFVYATSLLPAHTSAPSLLQFFASAGFGKVAYTSTSSAWAGLAMHFVISVGWGIGYAYMAYAKPSINKNPLISGFLYGVVVYFVMLLVYYAVQALKMPDALEVYLSVIAHTVFFGVPIALVARVK
jgi:hypothetical protein